MRTSLDPLPWPLDHGHRGDPMDPRPSADPAAPLPPRPTHPLDTAPRFAVGDRVAASALGPLPPSPTGVVDQVYPVAIGYACLVHRDDARRGETSWVHEDWLVPA